MTIQVDVRSCLSGRQNQEGMSPMAELFRSRPVVKPKIALRTLLLSGVGLLTLIQVRPLPAGAQTTTSRTSVQLGADQSAPRAAAGAKAKATASDDKLESVVVTARRRSELLQKTPVTVSAFSTVQLQRLQVTNATDLSGKSPNVQVQATGAGSGALQVFIRGVGNDSLAFNVENPVGVYLDDVYFGRVQGALLDLLDFDRIEILRGPQGTLYGRNSTVGALKYITREPDLEQAHYTFQGTYGSYDRADAMLRASVPIIKDKLAVELALGTQNQIGYLDVIDAQGNRTGEHEDNIRRKEGRLAVRWTPTDRLSVNLSADFGRDQSGSTAGTPVICASEQGGCTNTYRSPYVVGANGSNDGHVYTYGVAARVEYALEPVTLKSISSYRSTTDRDAIDFNSLVDGGELLVDDKNQHQYSQEFQAASNWSGPFKIVAGLFYFNENIVHDDNFLGEDRNIDHQISNSVAGFAEASYALTSRLNLTLGARYSYDEKSIDRIILTGDGSGQLYKGSSSFTTTKPTYKAGLDYSFTSRVMAYLTYSTGYRPGTYASTYPTAAQISTNSVLNTTSTETADNIELGVKSTLFNQHMTLNVDGFYTKYNNLQFESSAPPFPVLSQNVDIKGVEGEFSARPVRGLTVYGNGGYLESIINSGPQEGETTRYSPKFQFALGGEYRRPVAPGVEMFVGSNVVFTSTFRTDNSFVSSVIQKSYALVGARIGAVFGDGKYQLSIDGRNLTNQAYFLATNPDAVRFFGQPRTIAATLTVRM
jgi:iron complex outermembrane receptor protein